MSDQELRLPVVTTKHRMLVQAKIVVPSGDTVIESKPLPHPGTLADGRRTIEVAGLNLDAIALRQLADWLESDDSIPKMEVA